MHDEITINMMHLFVYISYNISDNTSYYISDNISYNISYDISDIQSKHAYSILRTNFYINMTCAVLWVQSLCNTCAFLKEKFILVLIFVTTVIITSLWKLSRQAFLKIKSFKGYLINCKIPIKFQCAFIVGFFWRGEGVEKIN